MRKLVFIIFAITICTNTISAQDSTLKYVDTGIGMGLNYGGFGTSVAFTISPYISIEGYCGYNLVDIAGGGALNIYLIPKRNITSYSLALKSMYAKIQLVSATVSLSKIKNLDFLSLKGKA